MMIGSPPRQLWEPIIINGCACKALRDLYTDVLLLLLQGPNVKT